ncbi:MAG: uncharacterized protein A8A55_1270 [Amphiamblys sp. WSBS2006]|nr:MAG: uncharacterized protein A8A55_1270 [Amphiamblys sp. WSBS2006]
MTSVTVFSNHFLADGLFFAKTEKGLMVVPSKTEMYELRKQSGSAFKWRLEKKEVTSFYDFLGGGAKSTDKGFLPGGEEGGVCFSSGSMERLVNDVYSLCGEMGKTPVCSEKTKIGFPVAEQYAIAGTGVVLSDVKISDGLFRYLIESTVVELEGSVWVFSGTRNKGRHVEGLFFEEKMWSKETFTGHSLSRIGWVRFCSMKGAVNVKTDTAVFKQKEVLSLLKTRFNGGSSIEKISVDISDKDEIAPYLAGKAPQIKTGLVRKLELRNKGIMLFGYLWYLWSEGECSFEEVFCFTREKDDTSFFGDTLQNGVFMKARCVSLGDRALYLLGVMDVPFGNALGRLELTVGTHEIYEELKEIPEAKIKLGKVNNISLRGWAILLAGKIKDLDEEMTENVFLYTKKRDRGTMNGCFGKFTKYDLASCLVIVQKEKEARDGCIRDFVLEMYLDDGVLVEEAILFYGNKRKGMLKRSGKRENLTRYLDTIPEDSSLKVGLASVGHSSLDLE